MKIKHSLLFLLSLGAAAQAYAVADLLDSERCYEQTINMIDSGDGCSGNYCARQALICLPQSWDAETHLDELPETAKAPIVLAFHGKGRETLSDITDETAKARIANSPEAGHFGYATNLHGAMPEAIVVYFQGLPITSQWLPAFMPNANPDTVATNPYDRGWQVNVEDSTSQNRDLVFVNAFYTNFLAAHLKNDELYAVGHSNGSRFVGVLWNRLSLPPFDPEHNMLKAIAFSAAQAGEFNKNGIVGENFFINSSRLPIFMGMGSQDVTVAFSQQQESIPKAKTLLNTAPTEIQTFSFIGGDEAKVFESADGVKLVTYIHPFTHNSDGHVWPPLQENKIAIFFGLQP